MASIIKHIMIPIIEHMASISCHITIYLKFYSFLPSATPVQYNLLQPVGVNKTVKRTRKMKGSCHLMFRSGIGQLQPQRATQPSESL